MQTRILDTDEKLCWSSKGSFTPAAFHCGAVPCRGVSYGAAPRRARNRTQQTCGLCRKCSHQMWSVALWRGAEQTRNYESILYRFPARFPSIMANFNPPHLHLSPPWGMIPFEFRHDLWHQKTKSPGAIVRHYLRDPMFSRFDTIPECDGDNDTDTTTAYTALA